MQYRLWLNVTNAQVSILTCSTYQRFATWCCFGYKHNCTLKEWIIQSRGIPFISEATSKSLDTFVCRGGRWDPCVYVCMCVQRTAWVQLGTTCPCCLHTNSMNVSWKNRWSEASDGSRTPTCSWWKCEDDSSGRECGNERRPNSRQLRSPSSFSQEQSKWILPVYR
jgi:hypothetical protein